MKLKLVDRIILVGIHENGLQEKEEIASGIEVFRIKLSFTNSRSKFIRYFSFIEFSLKTLFRTPAYRANIINCHSLHVLPVGVFLKIFTRSKLIYDAHELETEVTGSKGLLRYISKKIEKYCLKYIDELIVVSESIAKWYHEAYGFSRITTIYNVPHRPDSGFIAEERNKLRASIGIDDNIFLFIYQGILTKARGVDELLATFCDIGSDFHIVFMGDGPLTSLIKEASIKYQNIHYHVPVQTDQVLAYTREADVGIHIIKNTCLNHYYCLPNKIFEYLMSGIPFIVSNFPEMSKIVSHTSGGWTCNPDKQSLSEVIRNISRNDINMKKNNIQKNIMKYGWQIEEQKYIPIYKRLLPYRIENI